MTFARVAAVTGANKGIGLAIVRNLALQYPMSPLNTGPLLIYLTARDQQRGTAALDDLGRDRQLVDAKALQAHGGPTAVQYHVLDVADGDSISTFASFLKRQHPDGIDVLVNNAGVALDGFDGAKVDTTLACNYYGLKQMTEALTPLLAQKQGRVVNVASMIGRLTNKYSDEVIRAFRDASTPDQVTQLMRRYSELVHAGTHEQQGWPSSAYAVSKSGVLALTEALARQNRAADTPITVNACCPGYVNTDMTKHRGRKNVDQGAATPVRLALQDVGGADGEFWENEEKSSW